MSTDNLCCQIQKMLLKSPSYYSPEEVPFNNGLYFFYEDGETSKHSPRGKVIRIGNHPRVQNRLIGRLQDHYYGGKNGSVFRKLLGGALIRRANSKDLCLKHWEEQDSPTCPKCKPVEKKVSKLMRDKFKFRCVHIKNKKLRNRMEKILIATLSLCPACSNSTKKWLGRYANSKKDKVRKFGLWNSQYAGEEKYIITESELKEIKQLVKSTIKEFI